MIYNRTYADILNAKNILNNKIQKGLTVSGKEQEILDRAFLTDDTLRRIVEKEKWIAAAIKNIFGKDISLIDVVIEEPSADSVFTVSDFQNIISNIGIIIDALDDIGAASQDDFDRYGKIDTSYSYLNLNNIEKILYDMGERMSGLSGKWVLYEEGQYGMVLFINGAYSAEQEGGVLNIE